MSQLVRCPNCGGEHTLVNPGITMLVCSYCKTVVYWGDDQQLHTGKQSALPEGDTRLFMFASGKLQDRGFQVVGHLRYDHGRGSWDEWYLQLDDGGVAWVSEDARELTLEQAVRADDAPGPDALRPGAAIAVDGAAFTVREVGRATCVGGEGQLPFTILPGEQYVYADVASQDGQRFGTLEYDEQERPTCFVGEVVDHSALAVDDDRPTGVGPATSAEHIKCTNCSAPLEVPSGREVETLVCAFCGAQLDLTNTERAVLGVNPQDFDPCFSFEIGNAATLLGKRHEVCGRMLYQDNEGYESREYLLHNPESGYVWLVEEQGHFVLNRPTQRAPARDPFRLGTGQQVKVGSTAFRFYEQGSGSLVYVDGALPWLARAGDRFRYADLIAPPQIFSVESDGSELEYFHGRYMQSSEVATAFERESPPARGFGVHPAQPFIRGPVARLLMVAGGLFALLNLALAGWSLSRTGQQVFHQPFRPDGYLKESVSKPFELPACQVIALQMSAPLNNSWLAVDVAFINDQDQVVAEMDNTIEYYSGYEGGEHWTEGSRTNTSYFRAPKAGTYRLILKASGGSGERGPPRGESMQIAVHAGAVMTRYFLFALIVTGLFPLLEIVRKILFEKRRWGPVTDDDDDDD